ncbi:MAG: 2-(1,2-epoxy-1,2-dihydrophenyl)acetyl-CoA isomerase, partial [Sandaracinus sp.]|nr:2-(1,2-epoxy-1,2-dihydrophenyl)acetyl-CoA isomerase [Sandaracinus sp.]
AMMRGLGWDAKTAARLEAPIQAESLRTEDAKEGMAALLEKRAPSFVGR